MNACAGIRGNHWLKFTAVDIVHPQQHNNHHSATGAPGGAPLSLNLRLGLAKARDLVSGA